jgi:hypothetical protein
VGLENKEDQETSRPKDQKTIRPPDQKTSISKNNQNYTNNGYFAG